MTLTEALARIEQLEGETERLREALRWIGSHNSDVDDLSAFARLILFDPAALTPASAAAPTFGGASPIGPNPYGIPEEALLYPDTSDARNRLDRQEPDTGEVVS